jgi:hypothetical protein
MVQSSPLILPHESVACPEKFALTRQFSHDVASRGDQTTFVLFDPELLSELSHL